MISFGLVFQGVMGRLARPEVDTATLLGIAAACSVLFFVSILLHELGHALWALHLNWEVDKITLYALGGLAWVRSRGPYYSPRAYFQVIAAGPLVTVALVLLFGAAERAGEALAWPEPVLDVARYLTWVNLVLLLFNLAPAFPLDGGQMLRAWLWRRSGDAAAATISAVRAGALIGYLTLAAAIVLLATGNLGLGFAAAYAGGLILFLASRFPGATSAAAPARPEVVGDLIRARPVPVSDDASVSDFIDSVGASGDHSTRALEVTRDGAPVGYISLGLAHEVPADERDRAPLLDVMVPRDGAVELDPNTPLEQALEQLTDAGKAVVVEEGRVTGIVLRRAIAGALLDAAEAKRREPRPGGPAW